MSLTSSLQGRFLSPSTLAIIKQKQKQKPKQNQQHTTWNKKDIQRTKKTTKALRSSSYNGKVMFCYSIPTCIPSRRHGNIESGWLLQVAHSERFRCIHPNRWQELTRFLKVNTSSLTKANKIVFEVLRNGLHKLLTSRFDGSQLLGYVSRAVRPSVSCNNTSLFLRDFFD